MAAAAAGSSGNQSFDLLKFFIMVMTVLTTIVAGFTILLYTRYSSGHTSLKMELNRLKKMKAQAETSDDLRTWIITDRKAQQNPRRLEDLQPFLNSLIERRSLKLSAFNPQGLQNRGNFDEMSFRLQIDDIDSRNLTDFLFDCQNEWPGLKVKLLTLTQVPKQDLLWKAAITVALYSPSERGR